LKAEKQNKNKVLMIGPYSAVGGVSTHIKRLSEIIESDFDFSFIDESPLKKNCSVYNLRSLNLLKYFKLILNADLIHIHSGHWWLRILHIVFGNALRKKVVITFHAIANNTNFQVLTQRLFCNFTYKTIVVSDEVRQKLGFKQALVMHAFLPPDMDNEKCLPDEIIRIIKENKNKKILIANAFRLTLRNNHELYGVDLLIDISKKINEENFPAKIIFVIASISNESELLEKYLKEIKTHNLENVITLYTKAISFPRLITKCDLVVRPTLSDGDALTIREALFLNKSVIASNVVKRPKGTILFENRNSEDLFNKIKETLLNHKIRDKHQLNNPSTEDLKSFYKSIYL